MRWYSSLLVIAFFWANAALGTVWSTGKLASPLSTNYSVSVSDFFIQHDYSEKIETSSDYKQVKYSKKLSRYSWLKDNKPKVLSYYNNLSRIVFYHNLPPVNFITREVFNLPSIDSDHSGNVRLGLLQIWIQNPPNCANRLGGWKESNVLYKGSLTYHSSPKII